MTDIAEFLTARWDEEETTARNAIEDPWHNGKGIHTGQISDYSSRYKNTTIIYIETGTGKHVIARAEGNRCLENAAHIAYWDPHRVLTDITAKRRILTAYQLVAANQAIERNVNGETLEVLVRPLIIKTLRETLRILASPYADHPDYQPEWNTNDD